VSDTTTFCKVLLTSRLKKFAGATSSNSPSKRADGFLALPVRNAKFQTRESQLIGCGFKINVSFKKYQQHSGVFWPVSAGCGLSFESRVYAIAQSLDWFQALAH
jgi:hypothetical protein